MGKSRGEGEGESCIMALGGMDAPVELWPFPKIWGDHLCSKMHQCRKFGENLSSTFQTKVICDKLSLKIPPHLKDVATIPRNLCIILMSENECQLSSGSLA